MTTLRAMGKSRSDGPTPIEGDSPVFETSNGYVSLAGGILILRAKGGQSTVPSFTEALDVIGRVGGGVPRPALWDVRLWRGVTPEAWGYLTPRIARLISVVAMLVSPDQHHLVGPFPDVIDRLLVPFRVFTDRQEAMEYLNAFVLPRHAEA